jgi:signal transduction histidine kinase
VKSLYLRIYLTVVAVLALFALAGGLIVNRNIEQERRSIQAVAGDRASAWAELIENSLPDAAADEAVQRAAVLDWSQRLRMPMALDDASGRRIATSESFARREGEFANAPRRSLRVALADGRALWVSRPALQRQPGERAGAPPPWVPPWVGGGAGLLLTLLVLFIAVAAGAYPVVRRLTRRLEALRQGVETFGAGQLTHRVPEDGRDEIAAVAASFNRAAQRIEELLRANRSLLANASHELRSPLARMKMAVSMLDDAQGPARERLRHEIDANIAELDALVEEVLLASRLDANAAAPATERVDLLGVLAEEAARVGADVDADTGGDNASVRGDERLLRRALRNLLENAQRYGGREVTASVRRAGTAQVQVRICDRGPGVPPDMRERIFEPFFRLPGHAEREGGIGLGLSLVRQIAKRHGGDVRCEDRDGGGSCFVLSLPAALA